MREKVAGGNWGASLGGRILKGMSGDMSKTKVLSDMVNVSGKTMNVKIPLKNLTIPFGRGKSFVLDTEKLVPLLGDIATGAKGGGEFLGLLKNKHNRQALMNILDNPQVAKMLKSTFDGNAPIRSGWNIAKKLITKTPIVDVGVIGENVAGNLGSEALKKVTYGFGNALKRMGANDFSKVLTKGPSNLQQNFPFFS